MGNETALVQQPFYPTWALIQKPPNYPDHPAEGKVEMIWETNFHSIYHRFSPYTDYDMTLINKVFRDKEPFYYIYADENKKGLNALKKYESTIFPIGSAPIDVIRVSKFLGSGRGITFLGKQFLLQTGNPFNETRIYNPISPIVAAGMGLALGSIRPQRHFDTSGGLAGIARSLIGNAIPDALFGPPKVSKPDGTAPDALTNGPLENIGGKGLIRAGTANAAKAHLESAWIPAGSQTFSFGSVVKKLVKSLFLNVLPASQSGIKQRSDESAYGLMVAAGGKRFAYQGNSREFGFTQIWLAGGGGDKSDNIIRPGGQNVFASRISNSPDGKTSIVSDAKNGIAGNPRNIPGIGVVAIDIKESSISKSPGIRYADSVGASINKEFQASTVMLDYSYYVNPGKKFPTKMTDDNVVKTQNENLKKVISTLKNTSKGLYTVNIPDDARVISSGNSKKNGYDRLFDTTLGQDKSRGIPPTKYPLGLLQDYRNTRTVDDTLGSGRPSMRLPVAGHFDAINTLEVLSSDISDEVAEGFIGWENRLWDPYNDDQIAFFFYDVVNEKYIPFRATVKGIVESGNASWEEMPFIGRADRIYSYGGFNRSLSLNFSIVISSLAELAPTWQRINYLTTLVKPSNYTSATTYNSVVNRFMIPPMVMITIGDLYKDQPVLIQTITMTVPEDASWETLNEENSPKQWEYLASYIKSSKSLYGQVPRAVDIGLTLFLLEKERAIVGGANFGHAPRKDQDWDWNTDSVPNKGEPNKFHKSLVVHVERKTVTTKPPTSTPISPVEPSPSPSDSGKSNGGKGGSGVGGGGGVGGVGGGSGETSGGTSDGRFIGGGGTSDGGGASGGRLPDSSKTWDDVWKRWNP